jgi:hypothetical protein
LRLLGKQHEDLGGQQVTTAPCSAEFRRAGVALLQILHEELALQSLVLRMQPRTLEDAAVQLGILFLMLNRLNANDLDDELRRGRLEEDIETAMHATAGLASVVCRAAGVDPADAGDARLAAVLALHSPTRGIETFAEGVAT